MVKWINQPKRRERLPLAGNVKIWAAFSISLLSAFIFVESPTKHVPNSLSNGQPNIWFQSHGVCLVDVPMVMVKKWREKSGWECKCSDLMIYMKGLSNKRLSDNPMRDGDTLRSFAFTLVQITSDRIFEIIQTSLTVIAVLAPWQAWRSTFTLIVNFCEIYS